MVSTKSWRFAGHFAALAGALRVSYPGSVEERFAVLETQLAYHSKELAELSDVLYRQQQLVDTMKAQLELVTAQLKEVGFEGDPRRHQPPPHY